MALISALYSLALTTGAPRVVKGARIEHVCGNPSLTTETDRLFGMRIVEMALRSLQTAVNEPTLFDPAEDLIQTTNDAS